MNKATVELLLATLRLRDGLTAEEAQDAWRTINTQGLGGLVVLEGAEIWLYRRLQQLQAAPPGEFSTTLRAAVHRSTYNNMRIDAQAVAVTALLNGMSIPWALVKGQARRAAESLYPFAGSRPVADVDLLVPAQDADRAWHLLRERGFRRVLEDAAEGIAPHHRPSLIDASNVSVELHTTTGKSVPPAEAWRRATECADTVTWNDVRTNVPNATELVWQALAHGVADGVLGLNLRTFLSVSAVLAERPHIDWMIIHERLTSGEVQDNATGKVVSHERACRFLGAAAWLAGTEVPAPLAPRIPFDLTPLLKWRGMVLESSLSDAVKERLLEEATRVEAMLPLTPAVADRGSLRGIRRRVSSAVARLCYAAWRAAWRNQSGRPPLRRMGATA